MCPFAQEPIDQKAAKLATLRHGYRTPYNLDRSERKAYLIQNILTGETLMKEHDSHIRRTNIHITLAQNARRIFYSVVAHN
jgi:hypothetical protein